MVHTNDFNWKIAGEAGDGILNAGMMLGRAFQAAGLWSFASAEYPSLIRGGHNHLDIRVANRPLAAQTREVHLLVAMNEESVERHTGKLVPGGVIIFDSETTKLKPEAIQKVKDQGVQLLDMPLYRMAMAAGGKIMRNVVAMGATIALISFDLGVFNTILERNFGAKKGNAIVESNIKAAKDGYEYAQKTFDCPSFQWKIQATGAGGKLFLSGNEAIALGAIKAGCRFFSGYPMTPASSVMHVMAAGEKDYGLVVKHTEDEISGINMAIGASFAGVRAMTATSGGGYCLMTEGFGLAAQTETPIVVVEAMRPGPATGMATHSGQGDLRFVLHASTDDAPRIVVAPGDMAECYYETIRAFNLAEKYQLPVIVLTDKYLAESYVTTALFDQPTVIDRSQTIISGTVPEGYLRYKLTDSGISPRTVPGVKGGEHVASSYEHDELGHEREEETNKIAMATKRFKKLALAAKELPAPALYGPKDADMTVLGWGSTKGPVLEAIRLLGNKGIRANFLQALYLNPFPAEKIKEVINTAKKVVTIEGNQSGQFASLIRENCLVDPPYKILKFDGRPFQPEDIAEALETVHQSHKKEEIIYLNNAPTPGEAAIAATINLKGGSA